MEAGPRKTNAEVWMRNGDLEADGDTGTEGEVVRYYRHPGVAGDTPCNMCGQNAHNHGWIDEGPNGQIVCPGMIVISQPDGTHYAVPAAFGGAYVEAVE